MVLAGAGRFGVSRGYNYQILAPKGSGGVAGAHRARKRRRDRLAASSGGESQANAAALEGEGAAVELRRLDPANWLGVVLRQCTKGQDGRGLHGGE